MQDSLEELLNNHADLVKSVAQALAALPRDLDRVCSSLVCAWPRHWSGAVTPFTK